MTTTTTTRTTTRRRRRRMETMLKSCPTRRVQFRLILMTLSLSQSHSEALDDE